MKIYNKVRIDMRTGIVEYEDSFMYSGPMIFMKGGGPSGTITFPTGITNAYQDYLGEDGSGVLSDTVDSSVIDLFNAALTSLGGDIMVDGGFDDSSSWNKGTGWAVAGSKATLTGNNTSDLSRTDLSLVAGSTYEVVYTVTNMTLGDGTIKVRLQGGSFGTIRVNNGVFTENLIAGSGTSGEILFRGFADTSDDFDIDTVTIKTLTGSPYAGQTAYNPDVAQDETADSPLSDMQLRHDSLDTFITSLDEETDWDSMVTKALGHSTGLTALFPSYDIDSRVTTLSAVDLTEANDSALSISAASLAASALLSDSTATPITDALSNLTTLQAQGDSEVKTDAEAMLDVAVASSLVAMTTRQAQIDTEIKLDVSDESDTTTANALTNMTLRQSQVDSEISADVETMLDTAITNTLVNITAYQTQITAEAISDATAAFETNAHAKSKTITANLDTLSKAAAILDSDSVIGTINTTVMSKITDMIATAVTAGITAVNATPVQDMVDAFEQRRKGQHFRAVNRFAGPLADAGAINSSAYIFGIAFLEAEFSREVSQFDAEASFKVYTEALTLYGNAFNATFSSYLQLYSAEFTGYTNLYVQGLKEYLNTYHQTLIKELDSADKMFDAELSMYKTLSVKYHESADSMSNSELSLYNSLAVKYHDSADRLSSSEMSLYGSMMSRYGDVGQALSASYIQAALSYNDQQSATFRQLATSHIAAEVQSEFAIRNQKVAWFTNSVKDMVTMLGSRVNAESGTTQLQAEISRLKMISLKEQTDRDAELDSLDALWDIKLYQYVANVLGAPGGGSGFIPDLPSTGASALSGALGGAGVAISAAGTGGVSIAALGVGAAIGGLAGLLE